MAISKFLSPHQKKVFKRLQERISDHGHMDIEVTWSELKNVLLGCGRDKFVYRIEDVQAMDKKYDIPAIVLETMIEMALEREARRRDL